MITKNEAQRHMVLPTYVVRPQPNYWWWSSS